MKDQNSLLSKINHDPKSNLYLMSLESEFIKDERNKIDIQEGIFQMDEEEKNLYKSRLSPYVSIDVIKLNEV